MVGICSKPYVYILKYWAEDGPHGPDFFDVITSSYEKTTDIELIKQMGEMILNDQKFDIEVPKKRTFRSFTCK